MTDYPPPAGRTDWIWTQRWSAGQLVPLLVGVPSGRRAWGLVERFGIQLFCAEDARIEYTHLETGETSRQSLYGWTTPWDGSPQVFLNSRLDPFTAAATLVHEVEHAQWYFTQRGGYEEHARVADLQFYCEHAALHLLPDDYFTHGDDRPPVVRAGPDGLAVDWLEAVTRWGRTSLYSAADNAYRIEYRHDGLEPVALGPLPS